MAETYFTAQLAIGHLVWNYAAGDATAIIPGVVTDNAIVGIVFTKKQYGFGHYAYRVDRIKKAVSMRGHIAHYETEDCVSTGGSVEVG